MTEKPITAEHVSASETTLRVAAAAIVVMGLARINHDRRVTNSNLLPLDIGPNDQQPSPPSDQNELAATRNILSARSIRYQ